MDFSDAPQASEPRRRGRPRSAHTVERDQRVLSALNDGPRTKEQLVAELSLAPQLVYLSLWRLRREGRVSRAATGTERHIWHIVT
jgi:predicted Rossmann fold nucleotide-binding protein DprA/Smf involved in DNA uptake